MKMDRSILFFYIISSGINLVWLLINAFFNENTFPSALIVMKIVLTIINSLLMFLGCLHENRSKRTNLEKILKTINPTIHFTLPFLEINFFSIFELIFLKKKSFIFLQTLFLITKLYTLNGLSMVYRKRVLANFSFFTMAFIFMTDHNYNNPEIVLIIIQSFFIYINLILPKLKWFKSMNPTQKDQNQSTKGIYEQFFLTDSRPAFILEKNKTNENDYRLVLINKNAQSLFNLRKTDELINYQKLNHKFKEIFIGYKNSRIIEKGSLKSIFYDSLKVEGDLISNSQKYFELSDFLMDFLFDDRIKKTVEVYLKNIKTNDPHHYKFEILKLNHIKDKSFFAFLINDLKKKDHCQNLKSLNNANNRLFCSLSHELKTPINGALPCLEIVKSKLVCEDLIGLLDISMVSLKLLDNSLSNILDYYLFQTNQIILNKRKFIFEDLINELMSIISPMINVKRLELHLDIPPEIYQVSIISDYVKLRQILLNLLTNAIQFTFHGQVVFKIRQSLENKNIFNFSIEDSGIGIESEKLLKILKKIKEPDQEHLNINSTGMCMGLIINEKFLMLLGNYEGLSIVSELGKGSEFSFAISSEIYFKTIPEKHNLKSLKLKKKFNRRIQTTNFLIQKSIEIEEKRQNNLSENKTKGTNTFYYLNATIVENPSYNTIVSQCNHLTNLNTDGTKNRMNFEDKHHMKDDFGPLINLINIDQMQPVSDVSSMIENDLSYNSFPSFQRKADRTIDFVLNKACDCDMILCVDDDAFNLLSLEMILKSFNIKCCKVMNGLAAIEELKRKPCSQADCHKFKLVLMDYQMPIMDGVQATQKIKEMINSNEIKKTTVIGCTAFVSRDEVLRCYEVGMKDVIFKPLNKNVIKSILLEWFANN